MKKIFRITESQLKNIIEQEISEIGPKGKYLEEWSEEDQTLAFYSAKFNADDLGLSRERLAEDIIGTSLASLNQQIANFKYLMGESGLDRPNKLQQMVFEKYSSLPRTEFRKICKQIIEDRLNNPDDSRTKLKLGRTIGAKRDSIKKERLDALSKAFKGKDPSRFTLIGSRPKDDAGVEDEPSFEDDSDIESMGEPEVSQPKTSIDDVREFLVALYDKVQDIKSSGDLSMLDGLSDDIDFIKDYIDTELSPKTGLSEGKKVKKIIITESQLKALIKNKKKTLIESKFDYEVYHTTYSSAIREALDYAEKRGYYTEGDDVWNNISVGPKKPSEGNTNKITLTLYKDGKEQRKSLHIQIYNMGNKYELNVYIN